MLKLKGLNIIAGHYGSGKTNIAVNFAIAAKKSSPDKIVRIADLDIVNPYFRTADSKELLEESGVEVLIPEFANTNVDIPAIPPRMTSLFENHGDSADISVIDVGGDEGAVALGMYNIPIKSMDYDMFYIVNMYRPLVSTPEAAAECLRDIEASCGLRATKLINNSSLGRETTAQDIADSVEYAEKCAELCGIELYCHTYVREYAPDAPAYVSEKAKKILFPIDDIPKKLF